MGEDPVTLDVVQTQQVIKIPFMTCPHGTYLTSSLTTFFIYFPLNYLWSLNMSYCFTFVLYTHPSPFNWLIHTFSSIARILSVLAAH